MLKSQLAKATKLMAEIMKDVFKTHASLPEGKEYEFEHDAEGNEHGQGPRQKDHPVYGSGMPDPKIACPTAPSQGEETANNAAPAPTLTPGQQNQLQNQHQQTATASMTPRAPGM